MISFETLQQLTNEDIKKTDQEFDEVILNYIEKKEEVWKQLYPQMIKLSAEQLYEYRHSYTKWFAQLAWRLFKGLPSEQAVEVLGRVLGVGFLQDIDAWDDITLYLNNRTIDEDHMQKVYAQMRTQIVSSQEILYKDLSGMIYRMSDFVRDMQKVNTGNDALFNANLFTTLGKNFHVRMKEEWYMADVDDIFAYMKSLINFIIGVEEKKIYPLIEAMFYPQEYIYALEKNIDNANVQNQPGYIIDESGENEILTINETSAKKQTEEKTNQSKSPYPLIRQTLETEFTYDDTDTLTPLEDVMTRLAELAQEHNDPKIEELYMFDEEKSEFVWNEELLKH